jgi:hypothetical protein
MLENCCIVWYLEMRNLHENRMALKARLKAIKLKVLHQIEAHAKLVTKHKHL